MKPVSEDPRTTEGLAAVGLSAQVARATRPARLVALALAAWSVFACLYVMLGRITYPFELEWMAGSILDHIERVRSGQPVYAAPTADWIPFLYPPLYYWTAAAAARVLPLVVACRGVSIASTLVQAACVWRIARKQGATPYWSALGVGAFFAAYQIADYWYDLERPDSLFLAMVLVGSVVLLETRGVLGAAVAALFMGLAFFAKQPASVFIAGAAAGLVVRREWARAGAFVVVAGAVIGALVFHLQSTTGGWFGYYVLKMPSAHGMSWGLVPGFVTSDLPHAWVWTLSTAALVGFFVWRRLAPREDTMFVCLLAASFLASTTSRLHVGGWSNVLSFWTTFGASGIALFGTRVEAALASGASPGWARLAPLPPLVVALQLWGCAYDPSAHIPRRATVRQFDQFVVERVRELEKHGEVITVGRGHLTAKRHFHMAALIDVLTVEKKLPDDVVRAVRERRFAAIVIDAFDDLWIPLRPELDGELFKIVTASYYVAERLDDRAPPCILGWPARPSWVLLPREHPLDTTEREPLARRSFAELQVAAMREQAARTGTKFPSERESAEVIGGMLYERVFSGAVDTDAGEPPPRL